MYASIVDVCTDGFVKKRTNIILEMDLVHDAAAVLGTSGTTATVHAALHDAIRRTRLDRLAARDLADLTPESLEAMRRDRPAER